VASKKEKQRTLLAEFLAREKPPVIDERVRETLREVLAPVSEKRLRDLLLDSGWPLAPMVEGVRQEDLTHLERTLLALSQQYRDAARSVDRALQARIRGIVRVGKDHARLVARNPKVDEIKRAGKQEMILWMLTWLENPEVFELWVGLRKARLKEAAASHRL
jgi:hypothetical protein